MQLVGFKMNCVQFWYGPPPPPTILGRMAIAKSMFRDYTLIGDVNFLDAENFIPYEEYVSEACKDWRVADTFTRRNGRCQTDILRIHYMIHHRETWYLDGDAQLKEMPPIDYNRPALASMEVSMGQKLDGFILYSGGSGCASFWDDMLTRLQKKAPKQCFPMISVIPHTHDNVISPKYYIHRKD